ncbi:MAG: hypothetical protein AB2A00_12610 [Myxococcota bacterium]
MSVNNLTSCVYFGLDSILDIRLEEGGSEYVDFTIGGFNGPGQYTTGGNTTISFRAPTGSDGQTCCTDVGAPEGNECGPWECTFDVTSSTIQNTTQQNETGSVVLTLTCSTVGNAAIGCVECTMSPNVFSVSIDNCLRGD